MITLTRLLSLLSALHKKLGKVVWVGLDGQGISYIAITEPSDNQRVLVDDLGMADTMRWLEIQVSDDDTVLPDLTIDELEQRFLTARDLLLAEYGMRKQVFPIGHHERKKKLREIRTVIDQLVWMKDQLKPLAIRPPEQPALLEPVDTPQKAPYQYHKL